MSDCKHFSDACKRYRSKGPSKLTAVMPKHKKLTDRPYQKRKHWVYDAEAELNEGTDSPSEPETEEEVVEEIAALSKTITSKISRDHWAADSGSFSHMTDQLQLFSGPLMPIW